MTTDPTCAERIDDHYQSRTEDIRAMTGWAEAWSRARGGYADRRYERAIERLDEYPLGMSVRHVVRVELSTGGPADYVEADMYPDGEIEPRSLVYHFADWWDHAERPIPSDDRDAWSAFIARMTGGLSVAELATE